MSVAKQHRRNQTAQGSLFTFAETDVLVADPCRHRHGGAETSVQAHEKIVPFKRTIHAQIMQLAYRYGERGITLRDVAAELGKDRSAVSGRLSELREKLFLLDYKRDVAGQRERRDGCYVLIATE